MISIEVFPDEVEIQRDDEKITLKFKGGESGTIAIHMSEGIARQLVLKLTNLWESASASYKETPSPMRDDND